MANTTTPPDASTTFDRLATEPMKAWNAFRRYRDMGEDRSMESVRISLAKPSGYLRQLQAWSSRFEWVKRARLYDDHIERQARKLAEARMPFWARQRERSHRLNMKLARELRAKIRAMLDHPITVEVRKEIDGEQVTVVEPARWTYATVGSLLKIVAELEAGTIADAMMLDAESNAFDPSEATIEQLREFIAKHSGRTS
jgi:hypothetical protein